MSRPVKLAVLISGGGRTLKNLLDRIADGTLHARICAVVSSKQNAPGLQFAHEAHIPSAVLQRKDFAGIEEFSMALTYLLRPHRPDLICMAGFTQFYLIPAEYLGRVINIHPALLPKFGGKGFYGEKVHAAVLAAGEKESGCTVHFADNEFDHGAVILQKKVPVLPDDTVQTLATRVFDAECKAYPEAIMNIAQHGLSQS